MSQLILKREVALVRKPYPWFQVLAASIATALVVNVFLALGYAMAIRDASYASVTVPVAEDAAVQGCGITDPVACMTQIADSVADLFRPEMVTTVIITPGSEVICADAERAYWACANDADCPLETFEAIADDLNYCQSRR